MAEVMPQRLKKAVKQEKNMTKAQTSSMDAKELLTVPGSAE